MGQLPQRVMHLVRVGVVCAMLDEVRRNDGGHLFIVKGGTAMQLRLGIQARATTDLDVAFAGRVEDWLDRFDTATAGRMWNGFTVTRKSDPTQIEIPGLGYRPWRVPLQIRYEGREFGSNALEVTVDDAAAEHHDLIAPDGIELAAFAIDPPELVPCLDVPNQIAQKLHACTEPLPDGNERVRDIIDIWLLETLLDPEEMSSLKAAACPRSGAGRSMHGLRWPRRHLVGSASTAWWSPSIPTPLRTSARPSRTSTISCGGSAPGEATTHLTEREALSTTRELQLLATQLLPSCAAMPTVGLDCDTRCVVSELADVQTFAPQ